MDLLRGHPEGHLLREEVPGKHRALLPRIGLPDGRPQREQLRGLRRGGNSAHHKQRRLDAQGQDAEGAIEQPQGALRGPKEETDRLPRPQRERRHLHREERVLRGVL